MGGCCSDNREPLVIERPNISPWNRDEEINDTTNRPNEVVFHNASTGKKFNNISTARDGGSTQRMYFHQPSFNQPHPYGLPYEPERKSVKNIGGVYDNPVTRSNIMKKTTGSQIREGINSRLFEENSRVVYEVTSLI